MEEIKNNPTVSVITITYNMAEYLPQAIESVLNQSYKDYELIVIDDGSWDETEKLISKFDAKIVYKHIKNSGRGHARNEGLRLAKGRYIAFLDADDIWFKNKLKEQAEYIKDKSSVDILYSPAIFIDSNGRELCNEYKKACKIYKRDKNGLVYKNIILKACIFTSTLLIKSEVFKEIGQFDESFLAREDVDWYFRALNKNKKIKLKDLQPLAYLRIHDGKKFVETVEYEYLSIFNRELERYKKDPVNNEKKEILSRLYLACVPFYKKIKCIRDAKIYFKKSVYYNYKRLFSLLGLKFLIGFLYLDLKKIFSRSANSI